jgi:hypothetical protein
VAVLSGESNKRVPFLIDRCAVSIESSLLPDAAAPPPPKGKVRAANRVKQTRLPPLTRAVAVTARAPARRRGNRNLGAGLSPIGFRCVLAIASCANADALPLRAVCACVCRRAIPLCAHRSEGGGQSGSGSPQHGSFVAS